eukprot:378333-Amphidinium_carterae.3
MVAIECLLRAMPMEARTNVRFTSITVNRATGCKAHCDPRNVGRSFLQSFGQLRETTQGRATYPHDFWLETPGARTSDGATQCPMPIYGQRYPQCAARILSLGLSLLPLRGALLLLLRHRQTRSKRCADSSVLVQASVSTMQVQASAVSSSSRRRSV